AVDDDIEAVESPEEALGTAERAGGAVGPGVVQLDGLDLRQAGSLPNGGWGHAEEAGVGLVGDDQPAFVVGAHADPGAFGSRHAIEQLDAKIFGDLDLIHGRRLRRPAIVSRRLGAGFAFAELAEGGADEEQDCKKAKERAEGAVHGKKDGYGTASSFR